MEKPNFSYIDNLSGGDEDFKIQLLGVLKAEFPKEKEQYLNHIKENDYKSAASDVHKIKHKISILGLEKSYEIASKYEGNLKNNSMDLSEDFEEILDIISDFLDNI
jgi:HPt (histidine-containing phosphotransfer) domain-containing protein